MDIDADAIASAFADFPGFFPAIVIERSETCATRKLTQCTDFGVYANDVAAKFTDSDGSTDLTPAEFRARRKIIQQVERWCEKNRNSSKQVILDNEWTPILYKFEIVKTAAKTARDWGHLLFTDTTLSHFMLIMVFPKPCTCGTESHHDYGALTRFQADRLMSLLVYLNGEWGWGNKPGWIRATYVTPKEGLKPSFEFLDSTTLVPGENGQTGRPSIHVVTPHNFQPALLPGELEKIDNTIARGATPSTRRGKGVRNKVLGVKDSRPDVGPALKRKTMRECVFCKKVKALRDLHICKGCRLTWYCSQECQRAAWPYHKATCRKADTQTEPKSKTAKKPASEVIEFKPHDARSMRSMPIALVVTVAVAIAVAAIMPLFAERLGVDLR